MSQRKINDESLKELENDVKTRDTQYLYQRRALINSTIKMMHTNPDFLEYAEGRDDERELALKEHIAQIKIIDAELSRRKRMARSGKKKKPTIVGVKPAILKPRILK